MIAAALVLGIAQSCGAPEARTTAALKRAEADWVAALDNRDTSRLACRLAHEFVDSTWRGSRVDRQTMLGRLAGRPSSILHLTFEDVRLYGQIAVVHGLNRQVDGNGKAVGTVRFTDVFIYRSRRWQAIAAQETPLMK